MSAADRPLAAVAQHAHELVPGAKRPAPPAEDLARLTHELEVHQVELEVQNEQLRHTQAELEKARDRYRALFEVAPDGYLTLDERGFVEHANLTAAALLGVPRRELRGRPVAALVHADDVLAFHRFLSEVLARPVRQGCTLRFVPPGGAVVTMRVEALATLPHTDEEPRRCHLALVDIGALVAAQQEAAAAEARWRAIIETAADAIITADGCGLITTFNPAAERLLGHRAIDVVGTATRVAAVRAAGDQPTYVAADLPRARVAVGRGEEVAALHRNGTVIPVELSVALVDGSQAHTAIVRDVRERKEAERRQARLTAELRDAVERLFTAQDQERMRLAGELHDETGQVLTTLALRLERLRTAVDLEAVHDEAVELQHMVNQITASVGRLARGLHPHVLESLGLVPAIEQLARETGGHGLAVDVETLGVEAALPRDEERVVFRFIQEALTNVIRHAGAKRAHVVVQRTGASLRATVEDDGRGFDVDDRPAGLGLTAMRERAHHLGGDLDVHSAPGSGTTLTLILPHVRPRPEQDR